MSDRLLKGSPILHGNDTVPGVSVPKEFMDLLPTVLQKCTEFGLDYFPPILEMLDYDHMSETAAYGGFPVRYPHWKWGMEYEELARGYEYGFSRIYEMVVNTSPYCYIYFLKANDLIDHVTVLIHALGHSDFFKNNIWFKPTSGNMMNLLADNGQRIRKYMQRWGRDVVTRFIDHILRISTLIDPANAWAKRKIDPTLRKDERKIGEIRRMAVDEDYMEDYINTREWKDQERQRIDREDIAAQLDLFGSPVKDIFKWIKDNGQFKPWQEDIIAMLYDESMYFSPQGATKMLNEGWASMIDFKLGACEGLVALGQKHPDMGIVHYAKHKMGVLGGKWSMNPYKLGFELLTDIEDRWNKGKFGREWEECDDIKQKQKWDKKIGKGKEKMFEVRELENDFTAIARYFTPELCNKLDFYETKWYPNGEQKIEGRDFKKIKTALLHRYANRGLPDIRLTDPNHLNKGHFLMQHFWNGEPLYPPYVYEVLPSIHSLLNATVVLESKDGDETPVVWACDGPEPGNVHYMSKQEYVDKHIRPKKRKKV